MATPKTIAPVTAPIEATGPSKLEVSTAQKLVTLFSETRSTFARAKALHAAVDKGANLIQVAAELSHLRAEAAAPEGTSAEVIAQMATLTSGQGGTMISKASLHAYANAWASVQRAGLEPDEITVQLAFRLMSKGSTAAGRKEAEQASAALVESGSLDEARASYLALGTEALITKKPEVKAPAGGAGGEGDEDGSAGGLGELTVSGPLTAEGILGQIGSWGSVPLTGADFDRICDAFAEFVAARTAQVAA